MCAAAFTDPVLDEAEQKAPPRIHRPAAPTAPPPDGQVDLLGVFDENAEGAAAGNRNKSRRGGGKEEQEEQQPVQEKGEQNS